ncbi:hypothetical protein SEA_GODPOWER_73 [Streptomyces phage Godpower]|uniref:Uncharacterized protein n=3 Tax=Likavirus TaxID=1982880 RepID=R4TAV1_9CAUD|nr:hypothetical protein M051_gp72 [Streptomyces phage Lika]YP_008051475.1 hypothetical protein M050_gp73 [Streptomyces phage Sujidade]AGM12095.1 hypothetical protein LIKA_72 [Streptomyces phage Lika]AGM12171.1 hypothetical protein SUJIDADE_73 [Streptomyces phage Sujidade]AOQ27048.1 hypothetical protein SEA_GODPOWER_73 [Streptomyces phage Godpower]
MIGGVVRGSDFRCWTCVDFSSYERETNSGDAAEKCTYCKGPVWSQEETTVNVDIDTVQEYADNALERPSDAAFWDERCYSTHAPVIGWADRGDDILEESNYHSAKALIEGAATEDEHVFEGSAGHWLVGSLSQVWVQVYETRPECSTIGCEEEAEYLATYRLTSYEEEGFCEEHRTGLEDTFLAQLLGIEFEDFPREFTAAFIEAVEIQEGLKDYPIVDESDYSEREWARFEENLDEALREARSEYEDDTTADEVEIENRIFADSALSDLFGYEANAEVSWERVAEIYAEYRDAYFLERATEVYRWNYLGYNPDQLELFVIIVAA